MRISDWSSDVCSSDLFAVPDPTRRCPPLGLANSGNKEVVMSHRLFAQLAFERALGNAAIEALATALNDKDHFDAESMRSEEHTSELQSLMRISYAVFCLKKKNTYNTKY